MKGKVYLGLARRAARDLREIQRYSKERWGSRAAQEYLEAIEEALIRIGQEPDLLRIKPEVSPHLKFYRVRKHYLVCTVVRNCIYVLTIKHGAMDLPERIAELEPELFHESKLLHAAFLASQRK